LLGKADAKLTTVFVAIEAVDPHFRKKVEAMMMLLI